MTHSFTTAVLQRRRAKPRGALSRQLTGLLITTACGCFLSSAALAHEGHHDADDAPAPTPMSTAIDPPHLVIDAPPVELVAQREASDIVLYLDDYTTNAPLEHLQVSVRGGSQQVQAVSVGDGSYRLPGDLFDRSAPQPLTIAVHGPDLDLELQGVLPASPVSSPAAETSDRHRSWWLAGVIASIALLGIVLWRVWSRRSIRPLRRP